MIGGDAGPTVSPEPVLIGSSSRSIRIKTSASAETAGGQGRLPGNQTAVNKRRLAQPPCILELESVSQVRTRIPATTIRDQLMQTQKDGRFRITG